MFRFLIIICMALSFGFAHTVWAEESDTEAPAPKAAKVTEVQVREFPPLPSQKPSLEESVDELTIALFSVKNKFLEFMNATEERRNLMDFFDKIGEAYAMFKADPRGFLTNIGIDNEEILSAADKYIGTNVNRLKWYEKLGVGARILSCMSVQKDGNSFMGIEVKVPSVYYLKQVYKTSPVVDFFGSSNVNNITFSGIFPNVSANGDAGYNGLFVLPFVLRAEKIEKLMEIKAELKGLLCEIATGKCQEISLPISRTFDVNSRIASPECGVIKDFERRHRSPNEIQITKAWWDKDVLKVQAKTKETFDNPSLIVQNDYGITFAKPKITYSDGILKAAVKLEKGEDDAYGKSFNITFGYPYYFTISELVPANTRDESEYLAGEKVNLPQAFMAGLMLVFLSPLLALLIWFFKRTEKVVLKQSLLAASTIALVYPLFSGLVGLWGEQFTSPAITFIYALAMVVAGFHLVRSAKSETAGIIFAILTLFAPVHFIADVVNGGSFMAFVFMGTGVFVGFALPIMLAKPLRRFAPLPLRVLGRAIISGKRLDYIMLSPLIFFALWLAIIAFIEADSWWFALGGAFILLCFIQALRIRARKSALLFFIISALMLPFAKVETENTFSLANVQKALDDGKIVYAVVDTPWCLSCQLGKASFMASSLVRGMIANKDIVVLRAKEQNPDMLAIADTFELAPMPLHILYTKDKADGEIMPWFIQNYGAARILEKAGVKVNN